MADQKQAGMISGMSPLAVITGDELMEVSSRQLDGTWKTFSILINKIRTNQGLSAYEVAVVNGFTGTQAEWLESLVGKSAYEIAVDLGFEGTEAEFIESLVGPSAYDEAVKEGYNGTKAEWLKSLEGKSAYQIAVVNGFVGDEPTWLKSLEGKNAYQIAKELDPTIGTEADWIKSLAGASAYEVAVENGFTGTQEAWLTSLQGKSAYQVWVAQGNTGTEADYLLSLKGKDGDNGTNGKSAYQIWVDEGNVGDEAVFLESLQGETGPDGKSAFQVWQALPGNAGKTEAEYFEFLQASLTREKLQELLDLGRYTTEGSFTIEGAESGVITNAGFFNFLFLFDKRLANENNSSPDKVPQRLVEMSRMEAEGYSYWKNDSASTRDPAGKLPAVPDSEVRLYDDGRFEIGSLTDFISFGNGSKISVTDSTGTKEYDLAEATQGKDGKSAYEIWEAQPGNTGKTEAQFLTSLEGDSAYQVWLNEGNVGDVAAYLLSLKGQTGADGKSAYQVWLDAGNVGTVDAFFTSLKGEKGKDGTNGTNGTNGQSINIIATIDQEQFDQIVADNQSVVGDGYIVGDIFQLLGEDGWVPSNPIVGPAGKGLNYLGTWPTGGALPLGPTFVAGDTYIWGPTEDKKSLWTLIEADPDKGIVQHWVDIGVPGPRGASAYETWLSLPGNAGKPEADFIASIKGGKGDTGGIGPDGKSAFQVWQAEAGNAGKTEAEFFAFLTGKSAYQAAVDGGFVGTQVEWLESLKGESAYQLAVAGGYTGTQVEWIASLHGKSAYEIAVAGGYVGTEVQWVASLKGEKGEAAIAFEIIGKLTNVSELPRPGDPTRAYYVGKDLYVWIAAENDYEDMGSLDGQSAYELWVAQPGNEGKTEAQFLQSLHGKNLQVLGTKANEAAIKATVDPVEQDAWLAADTDHLWIFAGGGWIDAGKFGGDNGKSAYELWEEQAGNVGKTEEEFLESLKGTNGTNGTNGESAYEIWESQPANAGKSETEFLQSLHGTNGTNGKSAYELYVDGGGDLTEPEWLLSLKGKDGTDGATISYKGALPTVADLTPYVATAKLNDAYSITATGDLHVFDGAAFVNMGRWRGLDGTNGTNGTNGQSAYQVWQSIPGNEDKTVTEYIASLKGANGLSINPKGNVANVAALDAINPKVTNDAYTVNDTGHLFVYNGTAWIDFGYMRGADGLQGSVGQGLNIVAQYELLSERPAADTLAIGDAVFVVETHMLYQVNDAGVWGPGILIQGPEGEEGPEGKQGPMGPAVNIVGTYPDLAALQAAHPTGVVGDGYLIAGDLWLWNETDSVYYNAGNIKGPKGDDGPIGKTGLKGNIGLTGPRGSVWINLPAGQQAPTAINGKDGDWAIADGFVVFYRSGDTWNRFGVLAPGGVESPDVALGRVVRLGNQWVAESVPAVTTPVVDTQYVMVGIAGGKTEWKAISIPASGVPDVPANTTIPQARTSTGWVATVPTVTGLTAGKRFELKDGAWVESVIQVAVGASTKPQAYKVTAGVGAWVDVSIDTYSLVINTTASTGTFTPDFTAQQTFRVGTGTKPTINLPAFTTGRSMLAVFVLEGATNKADFIASGAGSAVAFNAGVAAADIEYGASQTVITAFWNGFGTWIISKGPSY